MKKSATKTEVFGVELRTYQDRDAKLIAEKWTKDNAILYQLPTGGGKSIVISKTIWDNRSRKILVLAHRKELLIQMRMHLQKHGLKVGLIVRDQHEDLDANIIIASIKTVSRDKRLELILAQNFDDVIVDEAHRILTDSYDKVLDKLKEQNPDLRLLGATATPYRRDQKGFNDRFQTLITSESTQALIDAGYLANYKTYYTPTKDLDKEVQKYFNDYQVSSLSKYMQKEEMINYAVTSYKELGENKQTLVFAVDKEHGKKLQQAYIEAGFTTAVYLDGDTSLKEREKMLLDFTNKKITHIISIETLTEGVDLPETGCIQLNRPTLSLTLYLQMIGRGLRPKEDGSYLIILDNAGCANQFGVASSPKQWSLNPEKDPNEGRRRNKIIGRKRDGSLTDDQDDMEFAELIEMTPEEYIAQTTNSIQVAEETNKKLDKKANDRLVAVAQLFVDKFKDKDDWKIKTEDYSTDDFILINNKFAVNSYGAEITIALSGACGANNQTDDTILVYRSRTFQNYKQYFPIIAYQAIAVAEIYKMLSHENFFKQALEMWSEVAEIKSKKVDLNELRNLITKAKEEQFEKQVDTYLQSNTKFILSESLREDRYFKGYSSDKILSITIPSGKINAHHNKISIEIQSNWRDKDIRIEEKNYIKGEKIIEMLKDGGWRIKQKQLN